MPSKLAQRLVTQVMESAAQTEAMRHVGNGPALTSAEAIELSRRGTLLEYITSLEPVAASREG